MQCKSFKSTGSWLKQTQLGPSEQAKIKSIKQLGPSEVGLNKKHKTALIHPKL